MEIGICGSTAALDGADGGSIVESFIIQIYCTQCLVKNGKYVWILISIHHNRPMSSQLQPAGFVAKNIFLSWFKTFKLV